MCNLTDHEHSVHNISLHFGLTGVASTIEEKGTKLCCFLNHAINNITYKFRGGNCIAACSLTDHEHSVHNVSSTKFSGGNSISEYFFQQFQDDQGDKDDQGHTHHSIQG